MPQSHDFSKSLVSFENDTTLVAVIELSLIELVDRWEACRDLIDSL